MTVGELEILLKTTYQGDSAKKMVADLDKISASGSKITGVMGKVNKSLGGDVFSGASDAFKRRNPHLFNQRGSAFLWDDKSLRQGAKQLANMGSLFYNGPPPPVIPSKGGAGGASGGFGGSLLSKFGLGGGVAGIAAALTYKGLNLAFESLTKTVKALMQTFENARQLYAKALTAGGLGIGPTARREALADIIGVSSKDVYQFGQAVLFLSPRLKFATDIMAKTTPNLTATAYEFKILKMNLEALFAVVANEAAPAIRKLTSALSEYAKAATMFFEKFHGAIAKFATGLSEILARVLHLPEGSVQVIKAVLALIASPGKDSGPAPQPLAYMKQIQASAWERMGLVIGGIGGGQEYARRTAVATEKTVNILQNGTFGTGKGRGSFYDPFMGTQSHS